MHFSSFRALRAWKNSFLSKIQRTQFFSRLFFMTNQVRGRKYRTKWKDLSIRFLIKHLFFEKSHFLHPHAQKISQKLRKSFTFGLKKSKKIQNFYFSKNASRWLLMTPNGFPSTPRTPKHLLEAPMHPSDTSKNFWQNRFLGLKMHFSSFKALRAWKTAFLSKI